jgi:hypothetical protein
VIVLRYEIWILLITLAAVVFYQLVTGRINTRGLLRDKVSGRSFSPGRLQMLIITTVVPLYYMLLIFKSEKPGELPEVPGTLLMMMAGSHAFYLGGKLAGLLRQLFAPAPPPK